MKLCTKCKINPRANQQSKNNTYCKGCIKAQNRAYYQANRDKRNLYQKQWLANNPEKLAAKYQRNAEWYKNNLVKAKEYSYTYMQKNREKLNEKAKEYYRRKKQGVTI